MSSYSSPSEVTWISNFCSLRGHEFFCEIKVEFFQDGFNLTDLKETVPHYTYAIDMVLNLELLVEDRHWSLRHFIESEEFIEQIEYGAKMLYGLLHARYIMTEGGMDQMIEKWQHGDFGYCPRVYCEDQPVLPIGMTDEVGMEPVKLYCPKCQDVYKSTHSRFDKIDGAYFGTGFPHVLFMEHPELRPKRPANVFVPRLYGFKIHPQAYKLQHKASRKEKREKRKKTAPTITQTYQKAIKRKP